jgi:hypothetical protein
MFSTLSEGKQMNVGTNSLQPRVHYTSNFEREESGSKTLYMYINFCVFEKNAVAVKVWNLLGNALERFVS